jgi:hypothetical protein
VLGSEKEGKVGDGTLGGGGRRVAYGAGRPVPLSTAAFFLAACADGTGEQEQQMSRAGAGCRGRAGVAVVADGSGMSQAGGSSGRGSNAAATTAAGRTGGRERVEPLDPKVRLISSHRP